MGNFAFQIFKFLQGSPAPTTLGENLPCLEGWELGNAGCYGNIVPHIGPKQLHIRARQRSRGIYLSVKVTPFFGIFGLGYESLWGALYKNTQSHQEHAHMLMAMTSRIRTRKPFWEAKNAHWPKEIQYFYLHLQGKKGHFSSKRRSELEHANAINTQSRY